MIWQVLLGLERRIGFWTIRTQAIDVEARGRERLVRISEKTDLSGAF